MKYVKGIVVRIKMLIKLLATLSMIEKIELLYVIYVFYYVITTYVSKMGGFFSAIFSRDFIITFFELQIYEKLIAVYGLILIFLISLLLKVVALLVMLLPVLLIGLVANEVENEQNR